MGQRPVLIIVNVSNGSGVNDLRFFFFVLIPDVKAVRCWPGNTRYLRTDVGRSDDTSRYLFLTDEHDRIVIYLIGSVVIASTAASLSLLEEKRNDIAKGELLSQGPSVLFPLYIGPHDVTLANQVFAVFKIQYFKLIINTWD